MHLLLIEDNTTISNNIVSYLALEGWSVDTFGNGSDGLQQAINFSYDCIILDVMLPGMDGFGVLAELRKQKNVPVIMTTAKGQLMDKQTGFHTGADDYLVKPFELEELVMRIRALVKRSEITDIVRWGDIEIDVDRNEIHQSGKNIDLTLKEWQILMLLIGGNGSIVQRTTIIDEIWGDTGIWDEKSDAKLDVYIANLRKKLDKKMIETVKGLGYKMTSN